MTKRIPKFKRVNIDLTKVKEYKLNLKDLRKGIVTTDSIRGEYTTRDEKLLAETTVKPDFLFPIMLRLVRTLPRKRFII